jgi:hypothetical protein
LVLPACFSLPFAAAWPGGPRPRRAPAFAASHADGRGSQRGRGVFSSRVLSGFPVLHRVAVQQHRAAPPWCGAAPQCRGVAFVAVPWGVCYGVSSPPRADPDEADAPLHVQTGLDPVRRTTCERAGSKPVCPCRGGPLQRFQLKWGADTPKADSPWGGSETFRAKSCTRCLFQYCLPWWVAAICIASWKDSGAGL